MFEKFLTTLAFICGPILTALGFLALSKRIVSEADRDTSWAELTVTFIVIGLLSYAWLIARYIL